MDAEDQVRWEQLFAEKIATTEPGSTSVHDPAHDLAHFRRVVRTARQLCEEERAQPEIVIPAAWLHDMVNVPKNDPRRSQASRLSAQAALEFLRAKNYPSQWLSQIGHAIEAHSYSAQIEPTTIEAAIVQDADRLDGLGAIGIARCFSVGGLLGRTLYHPEDPLGVKRTAGHLPGGLDDLQYTVDHFFVKLFKTAETLRTASGRAEGMRRARHMRDYLSQLQSEIY